MIETVHFCGTVQSRGVGIATICVPPSSSIRLGALSHSSFIVPEILYLRLKSFFNPPSFIFYSFLQRYKHRYYISMLFCASLTKITNQAESEGTLNPLFPKIPIFHIPTWYVSCTCGKYTHGIYCVHVV